MTAMLTRILVVIGWWLEDVQSEAVRAKLLELKDVIDADIAGRNVTVSARGVEATSAAGPLA
jgi:hypothetical protein